MGVRVACAVLFALASAQAYAQPGPPSQSPPPPVESTPVPTTATPPAPEPAGQPLAPPPPASAPAAERDGVMLLGGFDFVDGDRSQFLVVYLPLHIAAAPRLKLGLTGSIQYHRQILLDMDDLVLWA